MSTLKGHIYLIGDTTQVTDTFKKRELIIVENSNPSYPEHIKIEFQQDKTALLDQFMEGQQVEVFINIRGRRWVNKEDKEVFFVTIVGWKINVLEGSELPEPTPIDLDVEDPLPF